MITDLYKTTIKCSKYQLTYNDTITVTAKIEDYNNNPIPNKEITINSGQNFVNGAKSYTATTNENGEISTQYTANTWGIVRFSCNNAKVNVRTTNGFVSENMTLSPTQGSSYDTLSLDSSSKVKCYRQDKIVMLRAYIKVSDDWGSYGSIPQIARLGTIPSGYRPSTACYSQYIITSCGSYANNTSIARGQIYIPPSSNSALQIRLESSSTLRKPTFTAQLIYRVQ